MEITQYIIGIFATAFLAAGWIGVQFLARKMGTKNHFDNRYASCSDFGKSCNCGGSECQENKMLRKV